MTGTDRIKSKILEDARAKAAEIEALAKEEAGKIMDLALAEAAKKKEVMLEKARAEGAEAYRRIISTAGLEGRKKILKTKQDMVEAAFKKALEKVTSMPDKEYQRFLEDMVVSVSSKGTGEIVMSERDLKRIDKKFINNINTRLEKSGIKGNLTLSKETIKSSGGFILKSGDVEINSTLEIIFEMIRPECESDVVKILFQETTE
jgi:V/A-type H+-transporting ATPase subunit E